MQDTLAKLAHAIYEAEEEYAVLANLGDDGETFESDMGPPASAAQIDALEQRLGKSLPPSYRAFLSVHNGGWFGFGGGAKLLGTEDHADPHIIQRLKDKSCLFNEFTEINPIEAGAIPLVLGDSRCLVLLEPPVDGNGEMQVVSYYLTDEEHRNNDLIGFFETKLQVALELVKEQRKRKDKKKKTKKKKKKRSSKK